MKRFLFYLVLSAVTGLLILAHSCKGKEVGTGDIVPVTPVTPTAKIDTLAPSVALNHGGAYYSQADIDRAKANLTNEPWVSAWNKLIVNSHAQTSYSAHPTVKLIRGGKSPEEPDPDNYSNAMNDAAAAFQLGIRWKISGDNSYAQAAVNILNAWASTCIRVSGDPNAALALGIYGYEFAVAGEQLRSYSGWAAADFQKYQQWMITVLCHGKPKLPCLSSGMPSRTFLVELGFV